MGRLIMTDDAYQRINMLRTRIESLVGRCGGLRAAARLLHVDPGYLSRLRSGGKTNPSKVLLRKLGLRKVEVYQLIPQPIIRRTAGG